MHIDTLIPRRELKPLPARTMLVWHCLCGDDCPSASITVGQLITELSEEGRVCECCGDPADFVSYTTEYGEEYLVVDLAEGVAYIPRISPVANPLEVVTSARRPDWGGGAY